MKFISWAIVAAAGGLCVSSNVQAQEDAPWTLRLGYAHVSFSTKLDVSVNGSPVPPANGSASDNSTLGFELSYDFTPRWTVRFLGGVPPTTTLTGTGALSGVGTLGKVKYGPAALTLTYKLLDSGPVLPYIGAGVNYTKVFSSDDGFIANLKVDSAFGSVAEIGAEVPLADGWSISIDARKIFLKTNANGVLPAMGGAAAHADVRLNPLVVFAGVGKRF